MTQQSACGTCGRPVVWAKRSDRTDKWCPPLDATSAHTGSFIDEDGVARQVTVYNGHRCEPADIESWIVVLETREQLRRARVTPDPEPDPEKITLLDVPKDLVFDMDKYEYFPGGNFPPGIATIAYECSRCGTEAGEPCWSQGPGYLKRGEKVAIKSPHDARLLLAGVNQFYLKGQYVEFFEDYARRHQIDLQQFI